MTDDRPYIQVNDRERERLREFINRMDDDALAIIERRAVLAPGEEGLQGVRIISAIQEAASTGQTVDL